ncbi:hypothetical protein LSAT2_028234 [Lamellibrachia satsuma]|nr:hypothetical protein LSAT2_028234 [Lamellibrachia satsuma]
MENVIISGLQTSHRSYSRTIAGQNEHTPDENDALEDNVLAPFNNQLAVPLTKSDECQTLTNTYPQKTLPWRKPHANYKKKTRLPSPGCGAANSRLARNRQNPHRRQRK